MDNTDRSQDVADALGELAAGAQHSTADEPRDPVADVPGVPTA